MGCAGKRRSGGNNKGTENIRKSGGADGLYGDASQLQSFLYAA